MGIATVHYLSMNARDGQVTLDHPGDDVEDILYTYDLTSLQPETDYLISWGDTSSDAVTTDVDGNAAVDHTYADPGDYTIVVTRDDNGQIVAEETVTIVAAA